MAEGVRIHVMPKEFWNGKAVLPSAQNPAPLSAPLPVQPLPPPPPAGVMIPPKNTSRKLLFFGMGVFVFAALVTGGWYWWSVSHQAPVVVEPVEQPPVVKPVETPPVVVKPVETPPPAKPSSGKDTDSDGLTDGEEKLYGTDARNPDSDADSFLDGNEVFHRYDPLGLAPETLLDTGTVAIFSVPNGSWTMYVPTKWKTASTDPSVVFQTTSSAQVVVSEQVKPDAAMSLGNWYASVFGKEISSDIKSLVTKNGYQELLSNDKLTAYLDTGIKVYVFTYDLQEDLSIDYLTTFQMMVNSFLTKP